ncbi:MAG: hypothetical protein JXR46_09965 [Calditrichaceae bacterium]|nr:hypothetical protein [Calditrichaceae bacterium]MBN2709360.1 hypothetical protein [Calditrichaceae bacterium]
MVSAKRIIIATICGLICGFICLGLATSDPGSSSAISTSIKLNIVLSRTLLGFMLAISALRLNWWLHGIVLGFISSIPMAIAILDQPAIFIGTFVMGMIYGVLIELITTVFFKAKSAAFLK